MDAIFEKLAGVRLFAGVSAQDLRGALAVEECIVGRYEKGTVVLQQGDECRHVGLILSGCLTAEQLSPSGESMAIRTFGAGDCFAPAQVYARDPVYAYTLTAARRTEVFYIPMPLFRHLVDALPGFARNLVAHLADMVVYFSDRVTMLSQRGIRPRLVLYLNKASKAAGSLRFTLPDTFTRVASLTGTARPSVHRELKKMAGEGLLRLAGRQVVLLRPEAFGL
ncbi:MAG TPA: Crp/Fnr family transcriptional regulator [Clostridiales bacterium]|nr:MAG: cAMP-activated global transcriptional regulator CRP [Firmicutes bacterium ADurb.Bin262]HOU09154.1 Crp/Fnr family transcriptional regulator [Clostridiales bacterium]HQH62849.1 Crp/Fnr family transcriptional regulator [Clostridiales bacterium]HQK73122.1 Crp/Fnr family transcriptional regulator [Clostridiales bacterium]